MNENEKEVSLYMAGDLFNAGTRFHNMHLGKALEKLGWKIILPQKEALAFQNPNGTFDIGAVVADCRQKSSDKKNLTVANTDGTDGDSGTSIEVGHALSSTGRAVIYRTDFRFDPVHEVGLNAMYRDPQAEFVYHPCFVTDIAELEKYYDELALKIDEAIKRVLAREQ